MSFVVWVDKIKGHCVSPGMDSHQAEIYRQRMVNQGQDAVKVISSCCEWVINGRAA